MGLGMCVRECVHVFDRVLGIIASYTSSSSSSSCAGARTITRSNLDFQQSYRAAFRDPYSFQNHTSKAQLQASIQSKTETSAPPPSPSGSLSQADYSGKNHQRASLVQQHQQDQRDIPGLPTSGICGTAQPVLRSGTVRLTGRSGLLGLWGKRGLGVAKGGSTAGGGVNGICTTTSTEGKTLEQNSSYYYHQQHKRRFSSSSVSAATTNPSPTRLPSRTVLLSPAVELTPLQPLLGHTRTVSSTSSSPLPLAHTAKNSPPRFPRLPPATAKLATSPQSRDHLGHSHDGHAHTHSHLSLGHHHHHSPGDNIYLTSSNKHDAGVRITRIGLFVNIFMAISKGFGGWFFNSQALIADAFHALTDLVSDVLTLSTVALALKKPTDRFPNGYGKIESLGSLGVSGLLLAGGIAMGSYLTRQPCSCEIGLWAFCGAGC